jgi:hypothetical protein
MVFFTCSGCLQQEEVKEAALQLLRDPILVEGSIVGMF